MLALLTRIAPLWVVLLPLAAPGALLTRYARMRRAVRLGLVRPGAWRALQGALLACAGFMLLTFLAPFLEASLWPPGLAAALGILTALLLRRAAPGIHPGLRSFLWPMPGDGLELAAQEAGSASLPIRTRRLAWWLAPAAPAVSLLLIGAALENRRWPEWSLVGLALLAPLEF
ncbi:MAG: hypothetical protein HY784_07715 [Chloroflexi bacterium]|nr:hypothetical protein [Chloroflexota bacterium]